MIANTIEFAIAALISDLNIGAATHAFHENDQAGKVQTMVGDLMLVLSEDHSALPEMMTANMAARLARLGSLNCDPITNPVEAQRLIDSLFACENAEYTSTGRRVMSLIPIEDIDKKF